MSTNNDRSVRLWKHADGEWLEAESPRNMFAEPYIALPLPADDDAGEGECPACLGMKEYFNPATGMRRMVPCPECRGTGRPATPPAPATRDGEVERARRAFYEAARESMRLNRAMHTAFELEVATGEDHDEARIGADANAAALEADIAYDEMIAAERRAKGGAKP